jgi:hypothetical protein
LSGSVLFTADPVEVQAAVGAQLKALAERFRPDVYEYIALARGRVEREIFTTEGARVGMRIMEFSDLDVNVFVALIASAHLIITGRFHYNMAAAALGVPFVPLASNNEKRLCCELDLGRLFEHV